MTMTNHVSKMNNREAKEKLLDFSGYGKIQRIVNKKNLEIQSRERTMQVA
jgi:hypothetical protein